MFKSSNFKRDSDCSRSVTKNFGVASGDCSVNLGVQSGEGSVLESIDCLKDYLTLWMSVKGLAFGRDSSVFLSLGNYFGLASVQGIILFLADMFGKLIMTCCCPYPLYSFVLFLTKDSTADSSSSSLIC